MHNQYLVKINDLNNLYATFRRKKMPLKLMTS